MAYRFEGQVVGVQDLLDINTPDRFSCFFENVDVRHCFCGVIVVLQFCLRLVIVSFEIREGLEDWLGWQQWWCAIIENKVRILKFDIYGSVVQLHGRIFAQPK